jgi:hypothetical protein
MLKGMSGCSENASSRLSSELSAIARRVATEALAEEDDRARLSRLCRAKSRGGSPILSPSR